MTEHFDDLETRSPEARETALFQSLPPYLQDTVSKSAGWAKHLDGHDLASIGSREALASLPVLRKPDLMTYQSAEPPLGGFGIAGSMMGGRLFQSPGPVYEPQGKQPDQWRAARAMFAAGFRGGDIVHNCFSYHLTPGGFIMDEGARALGCTVIPAGTGNTEQQIEMINAVRPSAYAGTPDYLKVILDKAQDTDRPITCFQKALVSGGALFPSLREEYKERGIDVLQCYATADAGVIAYESETQDGLIADEGVIIEIVTPGTDRPVPVGDVGEVVVTVFNSVYPLIRFGTGDLSAILPGASACGRTNTRIKGWMGRADQRTKVKGMFVDPKQIDQTVSRFSDIKRARLVVSRLNETDKITLHVETDMRDDQHKKAIEAALKEITKITGDVHFEAIESLPKDGKIISDERDYSG